MCICVYVSVCVCVCAHVCLFYPGNPDLLSNLPQGRRHTLYQNSSSSTTDLTLKTSILKVKPEEKVLEN